MSYIEAKTKYAQYGIDTEKEIVELDPYVNGITSDNLIAGQVLCESILKL